VRHRCQYVDQSGAVLRDPLILHGPIANVALSRPVSSQEEMQQASWIQIKMLIDTGAYKTVIDRGVAEALGLEPIRFETMTGISHVPEECPVFLLSVKIGLTDGSRVGEILFTSEMVGMNTPPSPRPFNGLLGRDFLRHVRLSYDGPSGYCDIVGVIPDGKPSWAHGQRPGTKDKRKAQKQARKKNRH